MMITPRFDFAVIFCPGLAMMHLVDCWRLRNGAAGVDHAEEDWRKRFRA